MMTVTPEEPTVTRDALERGLLAFVNGTLLRERDPVDAESRLFEDGFIDSLRVLELIAYVERATGRKVPDRMVRLSTFGSVRLIAATFADGTVPAPPERERIQEYRADVRHHAGVRDALRAAGELRVAENGTVVLSGRAGGLFDYFDATFTGWALDLGADVHEVPGRIPTAVLDRADFTTAFPQLLVRDEADSAFSPAACYHCYPHYAGRTLEELTVTCVRARCARQETDVAPLERQREFTMREIVFFGSRREVEALRHRLVTRTGRFVRTLGLDGFVEPAEDPFFTAAAAGRRAVQRAGALKLELHLTLGEGRSIAVASFNHHNDHFGRRFDIALTEGTAASSGCVAFGLERWVFAFLTQHGLDERHWPRDARARTDDARSR